MLNAALHELYWTFILEMRASYKFCIHPSLICSIDIVTTKTPRGRPTTYSSRGGPKQKAIKGSGRITNSIVTNIWADGIDHTPCLLYTSDSRMAPTQCNTTRGKGLRATFVALLEEFGIDEHRINYLKSTKGYRHESYEIYEHFLRSYDLPSTSLILHDGGGAFKKSGTSVFEAEGLPNHVKYPSKVHQYLSPNDNNLHGCKATWLPDYYKFADDVSASLRLMQLIDQDTVENSKYYFERNLLLVRRSDLGAIIGT
jgi:hypothetical protein